MSDHPDQKSLRGHVAYWNFLPPDELDKLLGLYHNVSHKTLRISKTFGIEGKKLLTREDEFEALRDFNASYLGTTTSLEEMHLEYQRLLQKYPDLPARIDMLPGQLFSGKTAEGSHGVFFCYSLPVESRGEGAEPEWTTDAGAAAWYLYDLATGAIGDEPSELIDRIRTTPATPRHCEMAQKDLSEIRKTVEKHIKNTYLKRVDAPVGVKPTLRCWMELSDG